MSKIFGSHKLMPGCYYNVSPTNRSKINISLNIKWYGWTFLAWKAAHKNLSVAWYRYPFLLFNITYFTIKKWIGKG